MIWRKTSKHLLSRHLYSSAVCLVTKISRVPWELSQCPSESSSSLTVNQSTSQAELKLWRHKDSWLKMWRLCMCVSVKKMGGVALHVSEVKLQHSLNLVYWQLAIGHFHFHLRINPPIFGKPKTGRRCNFCIWPWSDDPLRVAPPHGVSWFGPETVVSFPNPLTVVH